LSGSTTPLSAEAQLLPWNRKFLGSKRILRGWIASRIMERVGSPLSFLDGFCGTGSVGVTMALCGAKRVVAVDSLLSNCVILKGFVEASRLAPTGLLSNGRTAALFSELNELPPARGYITESYGGTYFTRENCSRMDSIRERIECMLAESEISAGEHAILLAAFLLAADRVANTIGQYDAFLKHIGGKSMVRGRHLVDERVRSRFFLQPLEGIHGLSLDVVHGDMISLASGTAADVVYYDPPYNGRQYCDNYHVLENIARWQKPPLFGKTRKFDRSGMRSPFSSSRRAEDALERLITATRSREIFLSYSSEGILSREQIRSVLAGRGDVEEIETEYPVFGNGAGVSVRRNVTEMLFYLRARRRTSRAG
jgi:adenine-specific DNA methylase